ncbi:uncharacterized protein BYT42DRAFT_609322 [Radiomyces spectabilis]|uniref:uncharacterized protein n=1 Tax=Radiomyces spectabilis TaxID=64574 RepID=UPI00221EF7BB|nr:uncharacterized protein BYT42DRAFT_609322 [Radiomyces spectabilis]KAI8393534.1 hypothetical protein BYT42DRAFT_609322 [Radiomyces spectabilis]
MSSQAKFQAFANYDFDNDGRFQSGVSAIVNQQADSNQGDVLEKAKWFYYNKFIEAFDYDEYQAWKAGTPGASDGGEEKQEQSQDDERPPRLTFQEIVQMIETGQEIPGIKQIPDTLNEGTPSTPKLKARPKPWETKREPANVTSANDTSK